MDRKRTSLNKDSQEGGGAQEAGSDGANGRAAGDLPLESDIRVHSVVSVAAEGRPRYDVERHGGRRIVLSVRRQIVKPVLFAHCGSVPHVPVAVVLAH
jgi:hypothetical protein